ncbi:DsrE family protein [Labilibaculum manganireducens]|uniref:DsrE family protein n=1 Tax=Labilibaculum manganireducens TaxID=1940525 RepID=UPI0029F4DFDB|nr:DsrE family protein [Labilibaculum manganireducens]
MKPNRKQKLAVVWTSGDRDVALKMVFMYTCNAKKMGWWDEINLIVWEPSSKLLCEDAELQEYIERMLQEGISIFACKACADMYDVTPQLEKLNIDVKFMGEALSETLQKNYKVINF